MNSSDGAAKSRGLPFLFNPKRFADGRGWFMESYSNKRAAELQIFDHFVQDNHSFSARTGTIRGIHFQRPPHAQAKLVRCVRGAIRDYVVDLRAQSPTFGRWVSAVLSAEGYEQLYVPVGFGHAFVTLCDSVEIEYKVSDFYAPDCDGGIRWDDPDVALEVPLPPDGAQVSEKDANLPMLASFSSPFPYDGEPLNISSSVETP